MILNLYLAVDLKGINIWIESKNFTLTKDKIKFFFILMNVFIIVLSKIKFKKNLNNLITLFFLFHMALVNTILMNLVVYLVFLEIEILNRQELCYEVNR